MNYQFFGTAAIFCGVLWIIALVLCILTWTDLFCWDTCDVLKIIAWICFLFPFAFWIVIGVICGLNALWGWGLVQ